MGVTRRTNTPESFSGGSHGGAQCEQDSIELEANALSAENSSDLFIYLFIYLF